VSPVTFRLDLPQAVREQKVRNAFHANPLKPDNADTNFARQTAPLPPETLSDGTVEYEFESTLQQRTRRDRVEYLVNWPGYPDTKNSMVSCHDFQAPALLAAFLANGTA